MKFNRISVVTDEGSWLNQYRDNFISQMELLSEHVVWHHAMENILEGDIIFYLSFSRIVPKKYLAMNKHNIVVHASELPEGKGWSPMTWKILEGKNRIPMTLFEANEDLDSGQIYLQDVMQFEGHELIDELRFAQANCTIDLCLRFIKGYDDVIKNARKQVGKGTFYKKRNKSDSRLNFEKPLSELFNLLRVVDNEKYPAFFEHLGYTYQLKIEKIK